MIDKSQIEAILASLRSADLPLRLKALKDAQKLQSKIFSDNSEIHEWAYSALVVEQLFNLVCSELSRPQTRLAERQEKVILETKTKTPKPKKSKPVSMQEKLAKFGINQDMFNQIFKEQK